jgi:ribonuclease G
LIINKTAAEIRIALVENGRLAEIFIERTWEKSLVGNLYKGIVGRVLPGMNCAFIDIGLDKSAFLFGGDKAYRLFHNRNLKHWKCEI